MEQELGEVHGWPRIEIINIKYKISLDKNINNSPDKYNIIRSHI